MYRVTAIYCVVNNYAVTLQCYTAYKVTTILILLSPCSIVLSQRYVGYRVTPILHCVLTNCPSYSNRQLNFTNNSYICLRYTAIPPHSTRPPGARLPTICLVDYYECKLNNGLRLRWQRAGGMSKYSLLKQLDKNAEETDGLVILYFLNILS